ncbi:hypothetical protein OSB04_005522 [Centaurea solstitialis]|uniref:Endoglucanase n=1 Tax=Centaurea solstitialis TaxID=347529 RepID=A0AA38WGJ5_9ASTR|nr:hypothetical protein OSB04_005522 [Centaurea solstitialis]
MSALQNNNPWTLVSHMHSSNVVGSKWVIRTKYQSDEQPIGFVDLRFPIHICQLNKVLYGLKQALRACLQLKIWGLLVTFLVLRLSKYHAMANTTAEIIWVALLLRELHVLPPDRRTLLCDNQNATFLSQNPISHKWVKHIDIDYHFVRELVSLGKLYTCFVPTKLQLAEVSYILGDNPMKMSYVVGLGNNYPMHVHHRGASIPWDNQWHSCTEGITWLNSKQANPNELLGAMVRGPDRNDMFLDERGKPWFTEPTLSSNAGLVAALVIFDADGTIAHYKMRLVVNGRNQQQGIDCDETFSPVVKPATICIVLSLAVSRHWLIHQLDFPDHVCHLQRSLYGLKQVPRAWYCHFAKVAARLGFYHSRIDSSLFILHTKKTIAYLLLYVDDIILTASSPHLLHQVISQLTREFSMSDLGALNYFLGISIHVLHHSDLIAYPYSDWVGCLATRQSTSGVANVVAETCGIHNLLCELRGTPSKATIVCCDNISAVYLSSNPVQHQRTKHIEIDQVAKGLVRVLHVPSSMQYADIFTKGISFILFHDFKYSLNVWKFPPDKTAGDDSLQPTSQALHSSAH